MFLVWNVLWSLLPFVWGNSLGGSRETQFHHSQGPRRWAWKRNQSCTSALPSGLPMFLPKVRLCSTLSMAAGAVTGSTFFNTCSPGHSCSPQPGGSPHSKSKSQACSPVCPAWWEKNVSRVECVECSVSPGAGKRWGSCTVSKCEKRSEARGKAFPQPIRHITLKGKHISLLKPASIQYFPISSENIVTDVGHTVLHPLEATYQWWESLWFYESV